MLHAAVLTQCLKLCVWLAAQVRDWYVESFSELRSASSPRDVADETKFTDLLRHIYRRHANVVSGVHGHISGSRV